MKIEIKKLQPNVILPKYQTKHSAGMDLHACIEKPVTIKPGERALVPTGISVAIPIGYEMQIRGRSSLALKYGVGLTNGVGTIDADYRGEVGVILINFGQEDFVVNHGDRIAQAIITKYEIVQWQEVDKLDKTTRKGGFGSTGKD